MLAGYAHAIFLAQCKGDDGNARIWNYAHY